MYFKIIISIMLAIFSPILGNSVFEFGFELQDAPPVCSPGQDYIPDVDCTRYWDCTSGTAVPSRCGLGLYWNPQIDMCDFPSAVPECVGGIRPPVTPGTGPTAATDDGSMTPVTGIGSTGTTVEEDPDIDCGDLQNGFIAHPDCTKYYVCTDFVGVVYRCELGLLWNPRIEKCDLPSAVPECMGGTREPVTWWAELDATEPYDLIY